MTMEQFTIPADYVEMKYLLSVSGDKDINKVLQVLETWKREIPSGAIRTTFMSGIALGYFMKGNASPQQFDRLLAVMDLKRG